MLYSLQIYEILANVNLTPMYDTPHTPEPRNGGTTKGDGLGLCAATCCSMPRSLRNYEAKSGAAPKDINSFGS